MADSVVNTIIGSSIAVIGLMVSKESKVSEFRQQWINDLRTDVSRFCANALHVHGLPGKETLEQLRETNELSTRIRMRIDPKKQDAKALIDAMRVVRQSVSAQVRFDKMQSDVEVVVESTRVLIDQAWTKVKNGETRYRVLLGVALAALAVSVSAANLSWIEQGWLHLAGDRIPVVSKPANTPNPAK